MFYFNPSVSTKAEKKTRKIIEKEFEETRLLGLSIRRAPRAMFKPNLSRPVAKINIENYGKSFYGHSILRSYRTVEGHLPLQFLAQNVNYLH